MDKVKNWVGAILVIVILILLARSCNSVPSIEYRDKVVHITDTLIVYDTIYNVDTVNVIKWKPRIVEIEVPVFVDTNKTIKDYYSHKVRLDTSRVGGSYITIRTHLYKNDIDTMIVGWNILTQKVYITDKVTVTKYKSKNSFFVGGGLTKEYYNKTLNVNLILGYDLDNWKFYAVGGSNNVSIGVAKKIY